MPYHPLALLVERAEIPASVQPAVEAAALEHKSLLDHLARSPYTSDPTWWKLYTTKPLPPMRRADGLISRPLTPAQVDFISMNEDRATIIAAIMCRYGLSPAAQGRLATGKGLGSYTVDALYEASWATASARRAVAYKVYGLAMLRWLATADELELPYDEAAELIRSWMTWSSSCTGHRGSVDYAIFDVLEHRPALLAAAELPSGCLWAEAAANSRYLTAPVAEAILAQACSVACSVRRSDVEPAVAVLTGLIANPAVTTACADMAKARADRLVVAIPALEQRLRRADNIRKRINRLAAKVGSRSAQAPRPESFRDGATCVDWSTTDDPAVLKLLAGLRGNPLDIYNTAALAHNPHLGEQALRIGKRINGWRYFRDKCPSVREAKAVFTANNTEVATQIKLAERRWWRPDHDTPPTTGVAPLYFSEYIRPGDGYAYPVNKVNAWASKDQVEILTAVAEHMANRLGSNQTAWSLVFSLVDQFTTSDIDTLIDACLKLAPSE